MQKMQNSLLSEQQPFWSNFSAETFLLSGHGFVANVGSFLAIICPLRSQAYSNTACCRRLLSTINCSKGTLN